MLFSRNLKNLVPYVAGEQPQDKKYIKLNTNENPYPPCPAIRDYLKTMSYDDLKLYPDSEGTALKKALADFHGVSAKNIFIGNGSDEVLSFIFFAFFDPEFPVLYPEFTYSFYPVYADYYQLKKRTIKMNADFSFNIEDFQKEGDYSTIFPNPNAPTGIYIEKDDIIKFASSYKADNPLVIDEAYIDFGGKTMIPLIDKFKNLLVVRTMSKSASLAGMRIGYAVGSEQLINALGTVKDSFNSYTVNRVSQDCARLAIENWDYSRENISRIIKSREKLTAFLEKEGWTVLPSKTNFIFTKCSFKSGQTVYNIFRDNGILVRHFKTDKISDYVRITIGTEQEMQVVADCVSANFGS